MSGASRRVASFDIGSNTALMLVAERSADGGWDRIEDHAEITRISAGLDATGVLREDAVARTLDAVRALATRARAIGVTEVVATGTAPFRRASNGAEVAASFREVLGAPLDVVSGEREAALSLLATQRAFPELDEVVVVDIGGASTELIRAGSSGPTRVVSLDVGSVRLTERCIEHHPYSDQDVARLRAAIALELARDDVGEVVGDGGVPVVGIAGTVTTLVAVGEAIDPYDEALVHGARLTRAAIEALARRLASLTIDERAALPGLEPKRADVLPAGAFLLAAILERVGATELIASDRGVRWGRLWEL